MGWAYFRERGFSKICPPPSLSSHISSSPIGISFESLWYNHWTGLDSFQRKMAYIKTAVDMHAVNFTQAAWAVSGESPSKVVHSLQRQLSSSS